MITQGEIEAAGIRGGGIWEWKIGEGRFEGNLFRFQPNQRNIYSRFHSANCSCIVEQKEGLTAIFRGFFLHIFNRGAAKLRWAGGRAVFLVKEDERVARPKPTNTVYQNIIYSVQGTLNTQYM